MISWPMPQDLAAAFSNDRLRATVQMHANSVVDGSLPIVAKVTAEHVRCGQKPRHRNSCPNVMTNALYPLIVDCIHDCLASCVEVKAGTSQVKPAQLTLVAQKAAERLTIRGSIELKSALKVTSGVYGVATTIMGRNVLALNEATLWVQRYLQNVLEAYSPR
jgi:hypothetical protein